MEYRRLGKSGLQLSALSLGSWVTFGTQVDDSKAVDLMKVAYDAGVNFFDNAEVYAQGESERIMGRALRKLGWGRDTYCVSSKVFWGGSLPTQRGLSRKHITEACHTALDRLQVDYLDLFYCHRPDLHTPIEETVRTMDTLIGQGKVLYWGTSEWSSQQITEAHGVAEQYGLVPPTMEQPQYNLLHRERLEEEYRPLFERFGMGTTIWSPLASGLLTGKYAGGIPKNSRLNVPGYEWLKEMFESEEGKRKIETANALISIARGLDVSLSKFSIAWCLSNPNVSTAILGASTIEQLKENLEAVHVVKLLTAEVLENVEAVVQNRPELPIDFLV